MLAPTRRAAIVGQGGGFCGGRRLQVVVGELSGAVDRDGEEGSRPGFVFGASRNLAAQRNLQLKADATHV